MSESALTQDHKDRVRAQFGRTAQDYVTSIRHRTGRDLERLVELAEPTATDDALDVATGGGHTALAIAPHVRSMVASDLTPEMLAAAEAFISGENELTNVTFKLAEAEHLPFDDASFDIVSCRIAPHHFDDVQAFCREVARVLRPGGRFVLMDSVVPDDEELAAFINEVEWRRDTTHVRSYSVSEWTNYIEATGLVVDVVEPVHRRYEYASWTARSRMTDEDKQALDELILTAPDKIHEAFAFTIDEGAIESFDDSKILLRARKPAA